MQIRSKRHRKHKYAAPIGGVFVFLSLIGVITVIVYSLSLTAKVLDNSAEKRRLADIITPVMMFDPVPFESPAEIDMPSLLLYSMWAALTDERAQNYVYSDNFELIVPASDLDFAAARLFGPDIKLEHRTFTDYDTSSYVYNRSRNVYAVRISAQLYVYSPEVVEITREPDGLYCLDIYYKPPANALNLANTSESLISFTEKHMLYYMEKTKNSYQLVKIQFPPTEAPTS